jgi:hypothetical protein
LTSAPHGFELERHSRRLLATEDFVEFHVPSVGQSSIGLVFQNLAGVVDVAVAAEDHATADRPVRLDRGAEPILARERTVREGRATAAPE